MKKKKQANHTKVENNSRSSISDDNREIVLVAVTGMSPAVLTETIWALAHPESDGEPVIVPHRVVVFTTSSGRREIVNALFTPNPRFANDTVWDTLRHELEIEGLPVKDRLRFGTTGDDIRVFTKPDISTNRTIELDDIRTPEDNEAAADFILEHLRTFVEDPDKIVIGSLAGGRKTMSALIYACFCLIGRDIDRLTHVLVSEPYDQVKEFFFPGQPGGPINYRQCDKLDPSRAKIQLADIPFVPLRYAFLKEFARPPGGFMRLVELCNSNVRKQIGESLRVTISRTTREVDINGHRLQTNPREHLVLLFLAQRAKEGEPPFDSYKNALDEINAFREQIIHEPDTNIFSDWRKSDSLRKNIEEEDLRKIISGIRNKARKLGGDAALFVQVLPERGNFGLHVCGSMIFIK